VAQRLTKHGFDAMALEGGLDAWRQDHDVELPDSAQAA
jgi:rhodanese-related sulfurtransferase